MHIRNIDGDKHKLQSGNNFGSQTGNEGMADDNGKEDSAEDQKIMREERREVRNRTR
jgi:hypothetical protein